MTDSLARTVRRWLMRVWVAAGVGFMVWQVWSMQAHGVDAGLLTSNDMVSVRDSGGMVQFRPTRAPDNAPGLIFLPGAMVEPTAYAPLLRGIANAGYPVVLVRLPFRNAPTEGTRSTVRDRIAVALTESSRPWVLAGHSRGAALAAQFAGERAASFRGLVLVGTTHPKASSLADVPIAVTKIYGTHDCVADTTAVHANASLLPRATRWVRLDGANHSQFGWYGRQLGDCDATMSRSEQLVATREAIISALKAAGTRE